MKIQDTHNVVFRITGPDYDEGFPLLESLKALQEFQNIIDKAYMLLTGVSKMSYQERRQFAVIATRFNRGSLAVDMQLAVLAAVQSVKMGAIKPEDLWKIVKYGYDFFKLVFKFKGKGVTLMVNIDGDNNEITVIANNTGTINISRPVSIFINTAEGNFKRLASLVFPERIDTVTAVDKNGDSIELTEDDKLLFSSTTKLLDEVFTIKCDIYRYDKYSRKGKLIVFEGQEIPEGYYSFKSIGISDPLEILENMQKKEITVKALQEIQTSAAGAKSIAALNIISTEV